jgi:hypothetical protein
LGLRICLYVIKSAVAFQKKKGKIMLLIPRYVDASSGYTIVSGSSSAVGYTNQVGSFNNGSNYFDVYPPAGKSMSNLIAFIPSIRTIHYAGGVDGNDSLRCTYTYLSNRIRVYVQNTEQRSKPAANYLGVWS